MRSSNLFSRIMSIPSAEVIAKNQATAYLVDVILEAKTKKNTWESWKSYLQCLRSSGLKNAPNKTKLFSREV